jgi:hypothetical protein
MFAVVKRPHLTRKEVSCHVYAEFDTEKSGRRSEIDVVICAELFDPVNNEFLNQVGAISDAGDKGGAGIATREWESRTDRANKKRGHAHGDEWELPDTRSDREVFGFAEIQRVSD